MAFSSFLRRLRSRRRQRPQNPFTRTRLTLEHLELRDLPSTLTIDAAGALTYRASTSIANDLTLGVSGDHYTITDTAETILVSGAGSGGCTGSGTHTVTCPLVNVHSLLFILNDAGDALHLLSTAAPTTVNCGLGNDTISVGDPAAGLDGLTGALTVNGQGGMDTLMIDDAASQAAASVALSTTQLSRSGAGTITFSGIHTLTFNGSAGGDSIAVQGTISTNSVTINAGSGNDTVTVGNATGTLDDINGPLLVTGGGGTDTLTLDDHGTATGATYVVTASSVTRPGAHVINFSTLANVVLAAGAFNDTFNVQGSANGTTLSLQTGAGDDVVNVGNNGSLSSIVGPVMVDGQTGNDTLNLKDESSTNSNSYTVDATQVVRGGAGAIGYVHVPTVNITAGSGVDTLRVNGTSAAATVNFNGGNGDDVLTVGSAADGLDGFQGNLGLNGQAGNDALIFDDSASSTAASFDLTSSTFTRQGGGMVTFAAVHTLSFQSGSAGNALQIESSLTPTPVTVTAGTGADTITLGDKNHTLGSLTGAISVTGTGADDTVVVDDQGTTAAVSYTVTGSTIMRAGLPAITYANLGTLTLDGGSANDSTTISGTGGAGLTVINAGPGDNAISVGDATNKLDLLHANLSIHGQGGRDSLSVKDQGATAALTYGVSASTLTRSMAGTISYESMAAVTVNTSTGTNIITVASTAAGTSTTLTTRGTGDMITVGDPMLGLDAILGNLAISGTSATDSLVLDDHASTVAGVYAIGPAGVVRNGLGAINYSSMRSLTLNCSSGDNMIQVTGTSTTTPVTINAGSGNDTVDIGNTAGTLDDVNSVLMIDGQGGSDGINFFDQNNAAASTYTITSASVARPGVHAIGYAGFENASLTGGTADNTYLVRSLNPGQSFGLNAGTGNDTISVGNATNHFSSLIGNLIVNGQDGTDTLIIADQGDTQPVQFTLSGNSVVSNGTGTVTYAGTEQLTVNLGSGADNVFVQGVSDGTAAAINTDSGQDTVTVSTLSTTSLQLTVNGGGPTPAPGDVLAFVDGSGGAIAHLTPGTDFTNGALDVTYPTGSASHIAFTNTESVIVDSSHKFVFETYHTFLGRPATTPEMDYWVNLLPTIGQRGVVDSVSHSPEAFRLVVKGLYQQFLNRDPEPVGQSFWVAQMMNRGASLEDVAARILASDEFANRADHLIAGTDHDRNFIRALYKLVLNRPDGGVSDAEVSAWVSLLPSLGRFGVAARFLTSQEFRGDIVRTFYGVSGQTSLSFFPNLLHRSTPPTASEVASWVNASLSLFDIERGFASSREFFLHG